MKPTKPKKATKATKEIKATKITKEIKVFPIISVKKNIISKVKVIPIKIIFIRFKKKSFLLVYKIFPEDVSFLLKEIRNKKLAQCIIRQEQKLKCEEKSFKGHTGPVNCLVKLDFTQLATGSEDMSIKIWDFHLGKCIKTFIGHRDHIICICKIKVDDKVNCNQNTNSESFNGFIISGGVDVLIRVWNFNSGNCIKTLMGHNGVILLFSCD